ncbi:hypothetical protein Taro_047482 [Colocasia esculenta]|uniref:Uncharacterized protein n=1 Tax=Colocasia esculenta TaxID=4460 RepID=A0A843X0Y7_COLES|nr:hypothetical protein [Colocasia esculenta]
MGQAIRSRNLKKSGFSVVNGVWSKASVVEGEVYIGDASGAHPQMESSVEMSELPMESVSVPTFVAQEQAGPSMAENQSEVTAEEEGERMSAAAPKIPEVPAGVFAERRIEDILPEDIMPVTEETVASGHIVEEVPLEEEHPIPQGDFVMMDAPCQGESVPVEEDVPIEGEQLQEKTVEAPPTSGDQEELHRASLNLDDREGETASSSSSDEDDDQPPPAKESKKKDKETAPEVPLLTVTPFERQIRNAMKWFNQEMGTMKSMISEIFKAVGAQAPSPPATATPAAAPAEESAAALVAEEPAVAAPAEESAAAPAAEEPTVAPAAATPVTAVPVEAANAVQAAAEAEVPGLSGLAVMESWPSGPEVLDSVQSLPEEVVSDPLPPAPTSTHTPIPPSPTAASIAPPAPPPFKRPRSRPISSPTPFPSPNTSSSPASSTSHLPSSPSLEAPLASSAEASSSSGPSSVPEVGISTTDDFLHPSASPSFITIIPRNAQINSPFLTDIKDDFEEAILRSVLKNTWASFIQKEIKMIRHFQMFNNYRYLNRLPEVQLSQFKRSIKVLSSSEQSEGLAHLNAAQAREGKAPVSPATFLDMNSIHLVLDPYKLWAERYKVFVALRQVLKEKQIFYPVHINLSTSVGYMSHCDDALFTDGDWYNRTGVKEDLVVPGCCVPFECEGRPAELGGCFVHRGTVP